MARKSARAAVARNTPPDPAALEGQSGVGKDASYVVGYGRPPVGGQYKPGQSGNPRGRPKGARNVETELREEFFGHVTVIENGKRKKLPRIRVAARKLLDKAFGGDARSLLAVLQIAQRLSPVQASVIGAQLSASENDLLDLLTARGERIRRHSSKDGGEAEGKDGGGENA